jgi:hypothetical protein
MNELRKQLTISRSRLDEVNQLLADPKNPLVNGLLEIVKEVPNDAAKHEGGDPDAEQCLDHPSDILDYFMPKADVLKNGLMEKFERNYIEKHVSVNKTADALTRAGIDILVAKNAHE